MSELKKDLIEMLELFEEGEITYYELGEWLSSNGWQIAQELNSI